MTTILQDLKYGVRMLAKNPVSTTLAVIAMALGIGANTAIFSFADLLLWRPVALPELSRLVSVSERRPDNDEGHHISPANYLDLQAMNKSFESLAAYQYWSTNLTGKDNPESVQGVRVTSDFFSAIGVRPAIGRSIQSDEQEPGKSAVAIISDGFWRGRLGSDPAILGRTIQLDGTKYSVLGVMPRDFSFPLGAPDIWVPLAMEAKEKKLRGERTLWALGRLNPGVTMKQARAEFETNWRHLEKLYPDVNGGRSLSVVDLRDQLIDESSRELVLFLVGAVGFVLLIACANVANLQLARAVGRQQEMAVRAAMGASRFRMGRQLLTEGILVSGLGASVGILLAVWGVDVLRASLPADLVKYVGDWYSLAVDRRALAFTLVLAVVAGLISGLAPAWQNSRVELSDALKKAGGRSTTGRGHRLRNWFVVAEIALCLVLMIGTSLMIRGLTAVLRESPGLEPEKILTIKVSLPESRYREPQQIRAFFAQSLEKVRSLRGVQSAAVVTGLPYNFHEGSVVLKIEGPPASSPGQAPAALPESVSPDYFRTLRIPLLRGREFDQRDGADTAPVAIISQSMAQRLWPQQDPIGRRLQISLPDQPASPWMRIVGVVGDIRNNAFEHSYRSILYQPYQQSPMRSMDFAIRTIAEPLTMLGAVRAQFLLVDKDQPLEEAETLAKKINDQLIALRYVAAFMAIFGVVALILSAVGVYGVMAHAVTERTHEMGLRIALGARPSQVLRAVMNRGLGLAGIGVGLGIVSALGLTRLLSSVIYGVNVWDLWTFTGAPLMLAAVALAACYIPARRAMKVDPMEALRYE